ISFNFLSECRARRASDRKADLISQAALCYFRAWLLTAAALTPPQGSRRHGCPTAKYSFALAARCSPCLGGATGVKRRHALPKLSVGTSREEGVLLPGWRVAQAALLVQGCKCTASVVL